MVTSYKEMTLQMYEHLSKIAESDTDDIEKQIQMVSVLTGIPVCCDVAMTGEITLRGEVLPIGGLKEKLLAAVRGGLGRVLIPQENVRDLTEIPDNIKNKLEIIPVKWIDQVLELALESKPQPLPEEVAAQAVGAVSESVPSPSVITH